MKAPTISLPFSPRNIMYLLPVSRVAIASLVPALHATQENRANALSHSLAVMQCAASARKARMPVKSASSRAHSFVSSRRTLENAAFASTKRRMNVDFTSLAGTSFAGRVLSG